MKRFLQKLRYPGRCALAAMALFAAAWFLYHADPDKPFIPCTLLSLTGIYCPGCGTTRALHHYLHLDFLRGFLYNPILPFVAIFILLHVASPLLRFFTGKALLPRFAPSNAFYIVSLIVVLLYMLLRNLPFPALDFLRP